MRNIILIPFTLLLLASCASSSSSTAVNDDFDVDDALAYCHRQVHRSLDALGRDSIDYTMMPRNIQRQRVELPALYPRRMVRRFLAGCAVVRL